MSTEGFLRRRSVCSQDDAPLTQRDLCFVDCETTGPVFGYHEIIDIGAVRTSPDGSQIIGAWERRVKPSFPGRVTEFAVALTGFDPAAWVHASEPDSKMWMSFRTFANGCVAVCHNPSFDRAFVSLAAAACGIRDLGLDYHWIGTESLAWPLYRAGLLPRLSLNDICMHFGVPPERMPHSGIGGAHTCRAAYLALLAQLRPHGVRALTSGRRTL